MRKAVSVILFSSLFVVSHLASAGANVVSHVNGSAHQSGAASIQSKEPIDATAKTNAGAGANANGALSIEQNRGSLNAAGTTNANAKANDSTTVDVSKGK